MAKKFAELGDTIRVTDQDDWSGMGTVIEVKDKGNVQISREGKSSWHVEAENYTIVNSKYMNLKEKFALVFKGEPEKSFIKAGVMNADETLTDDGEELFLAWMLKKNGDAFKTEVVDPILAEDANAE